jgi:NADP-dependent 3-hydroxy acid dehydrogenase YdfG
MGAALALAFREAGLRVIATARNPSKMESLKRAGVETFQLDIQSEESIHNCVSQLSSLDILVNNAGGGLRSSFVDTDLTQAKELFDLNIWAQMAMIQACMPLLLKSDRAVIVNHSSSMYQADTRINQKLRQSHRRLNHPRTLWLSLQRL